MKLVRKLLNAMFVGALLTTIVGTAVMAVAARRAPDRIPSLFGRKILTVMSGSMEPAIHTGDVIVVRPLAPGETPNEGDVITFHAPDSPSMLITHRVVGIVFVNGVPKAYVTKGDANGVQDAATLAPAQVLGRYQWRVPYLGYLSQMVRKPLGVLLVVILPSLILIGLEFRKLWRTLAEAEAQQQGGEGPQA